MSQLNIELRATIEAMIQADPSISLQEVALQTGVTKARAHQLVRGMGYRFEPGKPRWRKTRPATSTTQHPAD